MAFKSNSWGAFPKNFGFSGSKGMREVRFMATGGKVQKVATKGLQNTDAPKFAVPSRVKVKDFKEAPRARIGSPSHGKGAPTGRSPMIKAKGGAVKCAGALRAEPRPKGGAIPVGSMTPKIR